MREIKEKNMSKELAKTYNPKEIEEKHCMTNGVKTNISMQKWTEAENHLPRLCPSEYYRKASHGACA